jgi:hypothetical protein
MEWKTETYLGELLSKSMFKVWHVANNLVVIGILHNVCLLSKPYERLYNLVTANSFDNWL